MLADRFAVLHPSDAGAPIIPFIISDGKTVINDAFIDKLEANKISAGVIEAIIEMKALAFTGGSLNIGDGKATIDSNGNAEFRGTFTVTNETDSGARVKITNENITAYDAGGIARVSIGVI